MSFELKPQIQISVLTKSVDEIVWTAPRSPVPPMLSGRVSDETWARTFDSVVEYYEEYLQSTKSLMPWIFIPCCIPCMIPKLIEVGRDHQEGWLQLLKRQQDIYLPHGIQITLAKELYSHGGGRNEIVGLKFEVGPMPGGGVPTTAAYPVVAQQMSPVAVLPLEPQITVPGQPIGGGGAGEDLVEKLSKLNELHQKGAINDQEYAKAKAKLLDG